MKKHPHEKRKFQRFETEKKVFFQIAFDVKTRVDFQIMDKETGKLLSRRYSALSKDVSADGLSFCCGHKLNAGDLLSAEVEGVQGQKKIIRMEGAVKWSLASADDPSKFNTGLHLLSVEGKAVQKTFHLDENNEVLWSAVLESILGNFKV